MGITSLARRAVAACAIAALAVVPLGGMSGAHAAPGRATFVDAGRSYSLTFPANWTRAKDRRFDLLLVSSDKNVVVIATSVKTSDPGPAHIKQDLPFLIRTIGTPAGGATYHMLLEHGTPMYTGLSTFRTSTGTLGVVVLEEAYTGGRLHLVAGFVLNARASSAQTDTNDALLVLASLNLQPSVLDMPSG
jgi:hypothetical protein